jgi:hypothetical protein
VVSVSPWCGRNFITDSVSDSGQFKIINLNIGVFSRKNTPNRFTDKALNDISNENPAFPQNMVEYITSRL